MTVDERGVVTGLKAWNDPAGVLPQIEPALLKWKFRPFVVDGRPVSVTVPVNFRFDSSGRFAAPEFAGKASAGTGPTAIPTGWQHPVRTSGRPTTPSKTATA